MASVLTGILKDTSNGREEKERGKERKWKNKKMSNVDINSLNAKLRQSTLSYYFDATKTSAYILNLNCCLHEVAPSKLVS